MHRVCDQSGWDSLDLCGWGELGPQGRRLSTIVTILLQTAKTWKCLHRSNIVASGQLGLVELDDGDHLLLVNIRLSACSFIHPVPDPPAASELH